MATMRVLMTTWGLRSHFYSLVPLGWALQAAGHEVRVASHPSMAGEITRAGLAAVPLGDDLNFAEVFAGQIGRVGQLAEGAGRAGGTMEPAITADGGVVRFARALLGDLISFGRAYRPELLVWEPFNLAGPVAAAVLGIPGVLQLWGPDSAVSLRMDPEQVIAPLAGEFRVDASDVSLTGQLVLDPVPAPMQVEVSAPARASRYVPYNGTAIVPDWLRGPAPSRPRVCITGGTSMGGARPRAALDLAAITRAVAGLDVEVVVVAEAAQLANLGRLPGNVRLAEAPLALRLVLPSCAVLVQHGGAGTMMTGLACGVPQLILPHVSDEHFNGERLAAAGAGTWLDGPGADGATIRDVVAELAGDGRWRRSAAAMATSIRAMPPPAEVVPALASLASLAAG
jgi:UDP:flavonoid glycosyltransferase YjiC (YdhE family)